MKLFRKIKTNMCQEPYLHNVTNIEHRHAVSKLRISAHRLPIEMGRYAGIPAEKRLCMICEKNQVGDEYHYVMECDDDNVLNLRKCFFEHIYAVNKKYQLLDKCSLFTYLLSMKDELLMKIFAKYVYDMLTVVS